jgi:uridine kinase
MHNKQHSLLLILGLAARIGLIATFVPTIQVTLFSPFLQYFLSHPSLDPWNTWISQGGASDSFPYGPVMLGYFSAFSALGALAPVSYGPQLGIAIGLLCAELAAWLVVWRANRTQSTKILALFAVSPILIAATYVHGQLDLFPSALLLIGLLCARKNNWRLAGLLIGMSAAAKFSAFLILPFFLIFLLRNKRYRGALRTFLLWLTPGLVIAIGPLAVSGYRTMVAGTPQVSALFGYSVPLGPGFSVLLAPILIAGFVAMVWHYRRANLGMLFTITAVALCALPLFMPSSPGWFVWGLMPLAIAVAPLPRRYSILFLVLGTFEAILVLLSYANGFYRWNSPDPSELSELIKFFTFPTWGPDFIRSATLLLGVFTLWRILATSLKFEDQYRLSEAPLSIVVAGDSGTGKDTLCASLASVFGESRCAYILGDDYHSFERGASAWGVRTHLNPAANDVPRLTRDSLQLLKGHTVWSRHYDHSRGRFTKPRKIVNGDIVAISGLHVVGIDPIRNAVDLSVFLDMDNDLRTLLKVARDMTERNQSPERILSSIKDREIDRNRFVQPQRDEADLVIALQSATPLSMDFDTVPEIPVINIVATIRSLTFGTELVRALTSIAGTQAQLSYSGSPGTTVLTIKATDWISSADISSVARQLVIHEEEVFIGKPQWLGGSRGVSQLLIVLALLERRQRKMGITA